MTGLLIDLFAGGGGASTGIEAALGRKVDVAINHSPIALAVHKLNHPQTQHLEADIWEVDPAVATQGRDVDLLWASPDCTHFSVAKGAAPRSQGIRSLARVVVDWAKAVQPTVICVENVREFRDWGPLGKDGRPVKRLKGTEFDRWVADLEAEGYVVEWRVIDSATLGAPTRRKRLFIVARCDGEPIRWPTPTHGQGLLPERTAAECIDWSLPCPSIFERSRPLAEKTLGRIAEGIRRYVLEAAEPFVVRIDQQGSGPGAVDDLREPTSTIVTKNRHGLVAPTLVQTGYGERAGQAPRALDLHEPLGTVVAGGSKHALVSAFLAKHFGGVVGHDLGRPVGTITAQDHHSLCTANLVTFRGTSKSHHGAAPVTEPVPTVTAGGTHIGEVRAFLTTYYGSGSVGQQLTSPMRTVTAKHRLGLVTVAGTDYQIADIGMRMLQPHELLVAQFGRYAATYRMDATKVMRGATRPLSKADQIRLIGNSVCPEVAEALVRCNLNASGLQEAAA